jgi:hypothetical protein
MYLGLGRLDISREGMGDLNFWEREGVLGVRIVFGCVLVVVLEVAVCFWRWRYLQHGGFFWTKW